MAWTLTEQQAVRQNLFPKDSCLQFELEWVAQTWLGGRVGTVEGFDTGSSYLLGTGSRFTIGKV